MSYDRIEKVILSYLDGAGYEYSDTRKFKTHDGFEIDILARKDDKTLAFEIVLNQDKIFDKLSLVSQYLYQIEVDEAYIVIPDIFLSDELEDYAQRVGVGIVTITEGKFRNVISSRAFPLNMSVSWSHPGTVRAEEHFDFKISVGNTGKKNLINTTARIIEAFPFKLVSKTVSETERISPGNVQQYTFSFTTSPDIREGRYPLFFTIKSERVQPYRGVANIEIKKR